MSLYNIIWLLYSWMSLQILSVFSTHTETCLCYVEKCAANRSEMVLYRPFRVGCPNQQPASVTGTRIIVYNLMTSFWRDMAFQRTDLYWYTQFYTIPVLSGGRRYGQLTKRSVHIITWQPFLQTECNIYYKNTHEAVYHRKKVKGGETQLLSAYYVNLHSYLRKTKCLAIVDLQVQSWCKELH